MPTNSPQQLAALLRAQSAGQGGLTDADRQYAQAMGQQDASRMMAGQGALTDADRAYAQRMTQSQMTPQQMQQAMGQMPAQQLTPQQIQQMMGAQAAQMQGQGGISDAERQALIQMYGR